MADQDMHDHNAPHEDDAMLDPNEAEEVIEQDEDAAMDSGEEDDEQILQTIQLQNDSAAHFDHHKKSIFCIAQHPTRPELVATGAGDDIAYIWDNTPPEGPVLPRSYESDPQPRERKGQEVLATLGEQDESVNAICFSLPNGEYVATATLAGKLNVYTIPTDSRPAKLIGSAKEVDGPINWMVACPHKDNANTIALGGDDGSVYVYAIDQSGATIAQAYFLHRGPCTAGAWTPDGKLLATVAEDSSLYVWDPFGDAAAAGVTDPNGSQAVFGLTADDERFKVDGGLYSVAITMGGSLVAVGGAEGNIRIVGLPRLGAQSANSTAGAKGAGARAKAGGAKQSGTPGASNTANAGGASAGQAGQAGQILASLQAQSDGVETLDFSQPPLQYLAAGSVDGSIAIFDVAHSFAVRRHIREAHANEEVPQAVTKVQFVKTALGTQNDRNWLLTSAGNDGVLRRWDVRGGTAAAGQGLAGEWRGHTGDPPDENGENGGGILDFVQGGSGKRVTTAGDDGIALVFEMS